MPRVPLRASSLALALLVALATGCGGRSPDPAPATPPQPTPPAPADPGPKLAGTLRYVALGDSTGFGVGALPGDGGYPPRVARRLREAGRKVELLNLSIPSATSRDLAEVRGAALAALAPDLVTIAVGANDVEVGRPVAEFARYFGQLCDAAAASGAAVVVVNVPDLSLVPRKANEQPAYYDRNRALNAEIARIAAERGFRLVDLFGATRARIAGHPEYFSFDGFHPSPAGYEVWADVMMPAVLAAAAER